MVAIGDPELAAEFERRKVLDQAVRGGPNLDLDGAGLPAIDADNREWLASVIAHHGWPGTSLVGEDGATAAFLIAQHADEDPQFQRTCLALIRRACADGEASAINVAYLEDRVRTGAGEPQRYGTQGRPDNYGIWQPLPIESPDHLDERRRQVGLEPFCDYRRSVQEFVDRVRRGTE